MNEPLPGGVQLSPEEIEALGDRWASAWTPTEIAQRLTGIAAPWCVAGGWAVDLFLGTRTRGHGDLEVAIPAACFPEIRDRFPGPDYVFDTVSSGWIWENAAPDVLAATNQTWLREPATGDYLVDVIREPHDGGTWICRHDKTIRLPYGDIILHSPDGIPYLAPELVLLFKAKHARPKDEEDFAATVPRLTGARRKALTDLLAHTYPGHRWLAEL